MDGKTERIEKVVQRKVGRNERAKEVEKHPTVGKEIEDKEGSKNAWSNNEESIRTSRKERLEDEYEEGQDDRKKKYRANTYFRLSSFLQNTFHIPKL